MKYRLETFPIGTVSNFNFRKLIKQTESEKFQLNIYCSADIKFEKVSVNLCVLTQFWSYSFISPRNKFCIYEAFLK